MGPAPTSVTVVTVAYGDSPLLEVSVRSSLASVDVDVDMIVVDNGGSDGAVDAVRALPGVRVLDPGRNTGFAGGCDLGAAAGRGEFVALVNPDARVAPDALHALCSRANAPLTVVMASLRLGASPESLNSSGNELHFLGLSWVGGLGEPASSYDQPRKIAVASGAALCTRRDTWDALGGLEEEMFAYHEDTDFSWRCHLLGGDVVYEPAAVVEHDYEFGRHDSKFELLERNRLVLVSSLWGGRTLLLLSPLLAAFELVMSVVALRGGWLGAKARGWRWIWRHRRWLADRRRRIQAERLVSDRELAHLWASRIDPAALELPSAVTALDRLLERVWRGLRRVL